MSRSRSSFVSVPRLDSMTATADEWLTERPSMTEQQLADIASSLVTVSELWGIPLLVFTHARTEDSEPICGLMSGSMITPLLERGVTRSRST